MMTLDNDCWKKIADGYEIIKTLRDKDGYSSYLLENEDSMDEAVLHVFKAPTTDVINRIEYHKSSKEKKLIRVLDSCWDGDVYYVIAEYASGISIWEYVNKFGELYVNDCLAIILDLLEVLHNLEETGESVVLSLDPDDIYIDNHGHIKIGFGETAYESGIEGEVTLSKYFESNTRQFNIYKLGLIIIYMCEPIADDELALRLTTVGKECITRGELSVYFRAYEVKSRILKAKRNYDIKRRSNRIILRVIILLVILLTIGLMIFTYYRSYEQVKEKGYKIGYDNGETDAKDNMIDATKEDSLCIVPVTDLDQALCNKSVKVGNIIYYINNGDVYSADEYGDNIKLLYKSYLAEDIYYGGNDWLYVVVGDSVIQVNLYNDQHNLFCATIDGGHFVCDRGNFYVVYDDEIRYINQNAYREDLNSYMPEHLFDIQDKCIYVADGYFYFYNEEGQELYVTDSKGELLSTVSGIVSSGLSINDEGLYYMLPGEELHIFELSHRKTLRENTEIDVMDMPEIEMDLVFIDSYSRELCYWHFNNGLVEKITDEDFSNVKKYDDIIIYYTADGNDIPICIDVDGNNWHIM